MSPLPRVFWLLLAAALLPACSSTPTADRDPEIEKEIVRREREGEEQMRRQNNLQLVMTRLDQALSDWVLNVSQSENQKAERRATALRGYLETQSRRFAEQLLQQIEDSDPRNRAIASGALGFSGLDEALAPLLNRLTDPVDYVRTNAALGVGTLKSPLTPVDSMNELLLDREQPEKVRRAAAWALVQLQEVGSPRENFEKLWPSTLKGDPLATDAVLAVHALRGVGLLRDPNYLDTTLRYFSHPKPLVRQAALVAAARCRNRDAVPMILPFLSPTETNPNVRLTARKALKALTGDRVDHAYDLEAWRQEFGLAKR